MRCHVDQKPAHSVEKRRELTGFHFSFEFLVSNDSIVLKLLVVDLRIFLLQNVLLVDSIVPAFGVLVLDGSDTLRFFSMIKEHFILPLPGLINNQRLHGCSIDQSFRSLALVTLAAHIVIIALVAPIILTFV